MFTEIPSKIDEKIEVRIQEEASKVFLKDSMKSERGKALILGKLQLLGLFEIKQYK